MVSSSPADRRQSVAPTVGLALAEATESRRTEHPMRAALAMREREREQQWQQMQDAGLEEQADGAGEGWGEVNPYCMPLDGMRPCGNAHAYVSLPLVVLHGLQDCGVVVVGAPENS